MNIIFWYFIKDKNGVERKDPICCGEWEGDIGDPFTWDGQTFTIVDYAVEPVYWTDLVDEWR